MHLEGYLKEVHRAQRKDKETPNKIMQKKLKQSIKIRSSTNSNIKNASSQNKQKNRQAF